MRVCRLPIVLPVFLLLTVYAAGQGPGVNRSAQHIKPAEAPVPYGVRYNSGGRRDPFLNVAVLKKNADKEDEEISRGQPPPGISGMYIAQTKLMGISERGGARTAVFQGTDKRAYFLQPGDRFFDGFLKEVAGDSVLMIRETKLRSGKVISQDVTKRLRQP